MSNNKTSVIITDFGPIRNFEFDINKSLIVTYGDNNIGKSYAMQIVYLLFKTLIDFSAPRKYYYYYDELSDMSIEKEIKSIFASLNATNPKIEITKKINNIIEKMIEAAIIEDLFHSFNGTFGNFNNIIEKKPKIILQIDSLSVNFDFYNKQISGNFYEFPTFIKYSKSNSKNIHKNNTSLTFYYSGNDDLLIGRIYEYINTAIFKFKLSIRNKFSNVYFLPASRSGIYNGMNAFGSIVAELSKNKGILSKKIELPGISEPISDYFIMLSNINAHQNEKYKEVYEIIEKDILRGLVKYDKTKNSIVYIPDGISNEFEMTEVSSMVSEISPIVAFLKYIIGPKTIRLKTAQKGNFIVFIEEPEAHLHPQNQIKLVEVFSKLPHYGINLILSSHSNYVFNKLNNLMLEKKINPAIYEPILLESTQNGSVSRKIEIDEFGATDENFSDATENLYQEREVIIEKLMRGEFEE